VCRVTSRALLLTVICAVLCLGPSVGGADPGPVGPSDRGWVDRARKPVPETERRRAVQDFCASLVVSQDPRFLDSWDRPSEVFAYEGIETVHPGAYVLAIVMFANPALDAAGAAHLRADFALLKPDGSLYGESKGLVAWDGPAPGRNLLELTRKYLRLRIEPDDPLGTYSVEATLHDTVSGHVLTLRAPLEVEAPPAPPPASP
jgi:hypothetical protein